MANIVSDARGKRKILAGKVGFTDILVESTISEALDLGGATLCGIITPDTLASSALGFQVSTALDGTYVPMTDLTGANIAMTIATDKYFPVDPALFAGVQFLKLDPASNESNATFTVVYRAID